MWISLGERGSSGDEMMEVLVWDWVGFIGGPIRQLIVDLSKVIILEEDGHRVALVCGWNDDVGVGVESADFSDLERLCC